MSANQLVKSIKRDLAGTERVLEQSNKALSDRQAIHLAAIERLKRLGL